MNQTMKIRLRRYLNVISSLNKFEEVNKVDRNIKIEHLPRVRKIYQKYIL